MSALFSAAVAGTKTLITAIRFACDKINQNITLYHIFFKVLLSFIQVEREKRSGVVQKLLGGVYVYKTVRTTA